MDIRVLRAARLLADDGSAEPVLIGDRAEIEAVAAGAGVSLDGLVILDPQTSAERDRYADAFYQRRRRKGITRDEARKRLAEPAYFGSMLVAAGDADALLLGARQHYPDAIRPALEAVGAEPGATVAGIYMMVLQDRTLFFADCTVNVQPDAERLARIATATAELVRELGVEPHLALLSFSNFGSSPHPESGRVADAVRILQARYPDLEVEGEMQADMAVTEGMLQAQYPFSRLRQSANVLIFPDLDAANICYKLLNRVGGAKAIGPILVGMAAPIHVLQRGSDVDEIVNMAVIAAVDAQERRRRAGGTPAGPNSLRAEARGRAT